MSRLIKIVSSGLILSGLSVIVFNQQSYDRQQRVVGMYRAARNSIRAVRAVYGIRSELNALLSTEVSSEEYQKVLEDFRSQSASTLKTLCQVNKGVYARMGQLLGQMTGILPEVYLTQFQQLREVVADQMPYEVIKAALKDGLQKEMKQVFDGFQTKPFKCGLFWQTHKSILLENYKESLVKVMPLAIKYQAQYDFWFIDKIMSKIGDYLKKYEAYQTKFKDYQKAVVEAEEVTKEQLDFQKEVQKADKLADLIYEASSAFYIPYYYKKYASKTTIIREFIEGVTVDDAKGLKEMGISSQQAFIYILGEVHRLLSRYDMVSPKLNEQAILIRKFIKPAQRKEVNPQSPEALKNKAKPKQIFTPHHQAVFLDLNSLQEVPPDMKKKVDNFWLFLNKLTSTKKKFIVPTPDGFYRYLPEMNNLKENVGDLIQTRYYMYQPLLKMCGKYMMPPADKQKKK